MHSNCFSAVGIAERAAIAAFGRRFLLCCSQLTSRSMALATLIWGLWPYATHATCGPHLHTHIYYYYSSTSTALRTPHSTASTAVSCLLLPRPLTVRLP